MNFKVSIWSNLSTCSLQKRHKKSIWKNLLFTLSNTTMYLRDLPPPPPHPNENNLFYIINLRLVKSNTSFIPLQF